jgi:hypothetical protein
MPVAARSKVWVCDRSHAGTAGWNHTGGTEVRLSYCVLLGRGLGVEPICRPEES